MENIIGMAISYLEENGIDTSNMSIEEIIEKYNEVLAEKGIPEVTTEEAIEEVVEEVPAEEPVVEETPAEEQKEEVVDEVVEEDVEKIISDFVLGLNEEQKAVFDKILKLVK